MYLSDVDIKKAVEEGDIVMHGFDAARLQPASYDILLGNKFIITDSESSTFIDPVLKQFPETRELVVPPNGTFVLHPGLSVLGTSVDYFGSDKYLIQLSGKSSLARIGLIVHNTAGLINPGHFLNITFELCNLNNLPIVLHPNMRIGQLTFSQLTTPPVKDYKTTGRYQGRDWQHYVDPRDEGKKPLNISKKISKKK